MQGLRFSAMHAQMMRDSRNVGRKIAIVLAMGAGMLMRFCSMRRSCGFGVRNSDLSECAAVCAVGLPSELRQYVWWRC